MLRRSQPPSPERRPRRRYHFGSPAVVYIFVTLLLALGAFNSQNNLLFWAFGFSLATLMVSGFLSGAMLMGIDVRRERIEDAQVGEPMTIRYRIRNRNRLIPTFALSIEELPASVPDGGPGRPRGLPVVHPTTTRIDQPRAFVAHVGAREQIVATCAVTARRRGRIAFQGLVVHTAFPFGLVRKSLYFEQPAAAVILPAPAAVDTTALERAVSAGDADRPGRLRGGGDEFHSLREYATGDSPRSIAWKASARRGVLLVRQALAPAPTRAWIVLRLGGGSGPQNRLDERAISIASTIIQRADALGLAIGLAVPMANVQLPPRAMAGGGGGLVRSGSGRSAQAARLLRELGLLEIGSEPPLPISGAESRRAEPFPRLSSSGLGDLIICIHAGPVDPAFAPGGGDPAATGGRARTLHFSAMDDGPARDPASAASDARHSPTRRTDRSSPVSGARA